MTSVRLEQITKRFGDVAALDDISLTIESGEIFFLLGPSGCGKSTLLRAIAGLHQPTSGRIYFGERDVTDLGTDKRNAVMCFQSYALWPHMTVRENVRFGLEIRKITAAEADKRVDEALELVQLEKLAARKPNQLSGGQQQRVALARAIVVHPDVLLLDEPLSNLDAKLRLEMRSEIRRICHSAGLTAIYVTHDQKEALSIADRMAVLNAGKVEQLGRPQDLYLRPKNQFVASFMGETNFIPGKVQTVNGDRTVIDTVLGAVTSIGNASASVGAAVTLSIRPEAIQLERAPSNAPNAFDGILHDTVYLGELAHHLLNVGSNGRKHEEPLKVSELNPRHGAMDDATEAVKFWFAPEDVVVLEG